MSDAGTTNVRPEITRILSRLRRQVRFYVLLEGLALVLIVVSGLFWISMGLDWGYFKLSRLELPVWFRQTFTIATGCLFVFGLFAWVLFRFFKRMRIKALALVLEKRFPELDDRLITAVEVAESTTGQETALTNAMLERTVREVSATTNDLRLGSVFDKKPLRNAIMGAVVLVAAIAGFWATNADAMDRWKRAFVDFDAEYWERDTRLVAKAIAQPGNRTVEFEQINKQYVYRHPRGQDLEIHVYVQDDMENPGEVFLKYKKDDKRGQAQLPMKADENLHGRYKITIGSLREGMKFWIKGGDFINRIPYRVEVVDSPQVENITLDVKYPSYTRLGSGEKRKSVKLRSRENALPIGTDFLMGVNTNKPLASAIVDTGDFRLNLKRESAEITIRKSELADEKTHKLTAEQVKDWWNEDGSTVHVPMLMSTIDDTRLRLATWTPEAGRPLPLLPGGEEPIRITLSDADGITMLKPYRMTLRGTEDRPPEVQTQLYQIRNQVTRMAVIPVAGKLSDDYGLTKIRFEYVLVNAANKGQAPDWQPVAFVGRPLEQMTKNFRLGGDEAEPVEIFDLKTLKQKDGQALQLRNGQKLRLTVYAEDSDNLWGPNIGRGDPHDFTIVSKGQLLLIVLQDQLLQLQRFRDMVTKVAQVESDLKAGRQYIQESLTLQRQLATAEDSEEREQLEKTQKDIQGMAETTLHNLRTSALVSSDVEKNFRDLLQELRNNGFDDQTERAAFEKVETKILEPLGRINGTELPDATEDRIGLFDTADRMISEFGLKHEELKEAGVDYTSNLEDALNSVDTLLEELRLVLKEMEDFVQFQRALKQFQLLIDDQEELKKDTRNKFLE